MIFNNKILVALALSSTMMVSTVEAKNLFKGAGRARGDVAAAETRFLKGKGGEGKGACNPKPPTCDGASGKGGKRGGKAGKNSCSGKGKNGGEPTSTVSCGDEFTGSVTLLQPLSCDDGAAIIMDGPEAVLDCGGFIIDGQAFSADIGIVLLNGATAINCYVTGFDDEGILLPLNGGTILDSTVIGNWDGIRVTDGGCVTMEDVSIVSNGDDGISLNSDTDVYLTNVYVVGNGFQSTNGHGLRADCDSGDGPGTITVVDSIFSGNFEDGVRLQNCATQLTFYGQNDVSNNGDDGITIDSGSDADIFVNGFLSVVSNDEKGLRLQDGKFTFNECSSGLICDNDDNIDGSGDLIEEDGNNVKSCNDFNSGEASACISEDE